jgi:hypothetical protein
MLIFLMNLFSSNDLLKMSTNHELHNFLDCHKTQPSKRFTQIKKDIVDVNKDKKILICDNCGPEYMTINPVSDSIKGWKLATCVKYQKRHDLFT